MSHALKWQPICPQLRRVQERARANRDEQFTSLAHYLTEDALLRAYKGLRAKAAAGPDGETKASYGKGLKPRLKRLHNSLKTGTYRATPARRIYLDKPDGSQRPINLQVIEDKIVQGATVEILNSIYEVDFRSCSYGFRPGRSQHMALQSLQTVLQKGQVSWVLDLDLKACFDRIDHAPLERNLRHYGLELNQAKTKLIRFGRNYPPKGPGRSENFGFLGLTHFAGQDRSGRYLVKRKTARKRLHRSLQSIKAWCRKHRHMPIAWQWKELSVKLMGHYAYYGIRGNCRSLAQYRYQTWKYWRQCLRKRSQTGRKDRLTRLLNERYILPLPSITHPDNWLPVNPGYLLGRAGCGKSARPVL